MPEGAFYGQEVVHTEECDSFVVVERMCVVRCTWELFRLYVGIQRCKWCTNVLYWLGKRSRPKVHFGIKKAKMVAPVACMRKMLGILNAIVRDRKPWVDVTLEVVGA